MEWLAEKREAGTRLSRLLTSTWTRTQETAPLISWHLVTMSEWEEMEVSIYFITCDDEMVMFDIQKLYIMVVEELPFNVADLLWRRSSREQRFSCFERHSLIWFDPYISLSLRTYQSNKPISLVFNWFDLLFFRFESLKRGYKIGKSCFFIQITSLYMVLVVFRRYAPGSYVLFLHEFTIYFMVLVNRIYSKT